MTTPQRDGQVHPGSLLVLVLALMSIGLVMVTSATAPLDRSLFEGALWRTAYGRQAVFLVLGIAVMLLCARVSTFWLALPAWRWRVPVFCFAASLILLVLVLHPGVAEEQRGSNRWLRVGPHWTALGFQPSEIMKLAMVAFLASLLTERNADPRSLARGFLPSAVVIGTCVALVGKEDFGTALLLAGVGGTMLLVAGCRLLHLVLLGSLGACGMSVLLLIAPYRLARLTAYRDIWSDPRGHGYQPVQSLVTIASGGWWGTGLGSGVQKHGYLPEGHTDFIFSVICEETGMLGGGLVIALFCAFVWLGLRTTWNARTPFERLLAFGITATIALQAILNIAVVTVLTPTTGVSLPLISAGGSGMLIFSGAVGLLMAIAVRGGGDERDTISADTCQAPDGITTGLQQEYAG